jgi:hypothetical protein
MKSYPRREFLVRALAACGTPFLVPLASLEGWQNSQANTALTRGSQDTQTAASYFGVRIDAARTIGDAYVRHLGLDTSAESIRKASRSALEIIKRASTTQNAITALERAVRRDFQEGRSVQLEGWILSRTEAELCALTLLPATN